MNQQTGTASIHDLAEFRARQAARARTASGVRRTFLWSWPATGQQVAAVFPLPAAAFSLPGARNSAG